MSLRTSEPGDGHVGARSQGPRRKAADGSEARGLQQAAWPHGPAGPVDISAPTPLTSVHLSDGVLTPVSFSHWQVDGERCHPATPPSSEGAEQCGLWGPAAHLLRGDRGLALLRAQNPHCTSQGICSQSPGAGRAQWVTCVLRWGRTGPLTLLKQGETFAFINEDLRTLKRKYAQIF